MYLFCACWLSVPDPFAPEEDIDGSMDDTNTGEEELEEERIARSRFGPAAGASGDERDISGALRPESHRRPKPLPNEWPLLRLEVRT